MFVRLRDFKRLIKEAYTGAGLYVARRGNQLLFGGSYWAIATTKESLDKKALTAVIELTGEMPEDGEAFKATKEANQYEINEVHWNLIDATEQYEDEEEKLTVTRLVLNKYPCGQTMRILQAEDKRVDVLGEGFIQAIDPASMNTEYEWEIEGTIYQSTFPKTGILEKRSNNPDRLSVRPRRYERKRSSGLFTEYEDRRIRRNGHGV